MTQDDKATVGDTITYTIFLQASGGSDIGEGKLNITDVLDDFVEHIMVRGLKDYLRLETDLKEQQIENIIEPSDNRVDHANIRNGRKAKGSDGKKPLRKVNICIYAQIDGSDQAILTMNAPQHV